MLIAGIPAKDAYATGNCHQMKTGTEFNLAQIIESLSATASVSRVIPTISADARQFSRILGAAMDATVRSESGMSSSAISESGSIMPLSHEGALQADAAKSADAALEAAEPLMQLTTVNFLSGRTILITPVDMAEAVEQALPQWWQDERPPHLAQSLSGIMALVHGNPVSKPAEPKASQWNDDFDIHSAGDREAANAAELEVKAPGGLDAAVTNMLVWHEFKQASLRPPREPAATLAPTIPGSDLLAERTITAAATVDGGVSRSQSEIRLPEVVSAPATKKPTLAGAALQQATSAGSAVPEERPETISVDPVPAQVSTRSFVEVSQLQSEIRLPEVVSAPATKKPMEMSSAVSGAISGSNDLPVPQAASVETKVKPEAAPTPDREFRQQLYSQPPPARRLAESSLREEPGARKVDSRRFISVLGESYGDTRAGEGQSATEFRREVRASAPAPTAVIAELLVAALPQGKTQTKSLSVGPVDVTFTDVVRDLSAVNANLESPIDAAAPARPMPASTALRQEFANSLLSFATEQLEIPEQGAVTRLRLEVSPPELGNLEIEVTQGLDSLDVRIFASDEAAAATLRESEHVMRDLLSRNDATRITIGIDVSARDGGNGRPREQGRTQDHAPRKPDARLVKIRLNQDNNFDIYV